MIKSAFATAAYHSPKVSFSYRMRGWLMLFILFSCESPVDKVEPPNPISEPEVIVPNGDEKYLNTHSDYLFDQEKLHTFELNLPAASLAMIDADPSAEKYLQRCNQHIYLGGCS